MFLIALTGISHGLEDGTVITVAQGESIPSSIKGEALKALKDSGAVGTPTVSVAEIDTRDARIAELEEALAAATATKGEQPAK